MTTGTQFVGEVLAALREPAGRDDPYPLYARLREFGPAVPGPDDTLVISGYRPAAALLRDHTLAKRPELSLVTAGYRDWQQRPGLRLMFNSLLVLNPPEHTRLRRQVSGAFTTRRVAALRPAVERIVAALLDRLSGAADFVDEFAFPLPVTVVGELLGIPAADRPMFQTVVRDWTNVLDRLDQTTVDQADDAAVTISDYLVELIALRRKEPADDLISALLDSGMTTDELVTMSALLLAAGFETTTGLLSNGLVALLAHPDQAASLRTNPGLAEPAVEELLRYDSPVQLLSSRTAPADLDAGGLTVRAGQRILILLGAANRDPAVFPDPDRLLLARDGAGSLSFGGGLHYCLGAPLARLEARIAFPALLTAFPRLALAGPPVRRDGLTLHSHTALPVIT